MSASGWVGSDRTARLLACSVLFGCVFLIGGTAPAQQDAGETTAEIRIDLPSGVKSHVSVSPGTDHVVLDLPRGASYPEDFVASSGGLLADAGARVEGDRVEIDLELVSGLLDRVTYEPNAVVLRFRSATLARQDLTDPEERYLLGADDSLLITVHNQPDLGSEPTVNREGWINAPLVGQVKAAGLTPRQLAVKLTDLMGRSYLVNPQIDVQVVEFRSQWVVINGEVLKPGRIPLRGGTRLKEVIGEAEGFADDAGEVITITRKLPGAEETRALRISREDFEGGRSNPSLISGDIIDVPRAEYCYIQGEVEISGRVRIERGMSLMRVIAMAEGLTDWANRKNVRILYGEGAVPRERVFNLNKIEQGKAEDPPIRGGEVVIVKKRFL